MDRLVKTGLVVAGLTLATAAVVMPGGPGSAQPARQSFDIVTGPAAGSHFPIGELIARVVSHPPGLARCEKQGACAPAGIIVSARSSSGAVANVLAVNEGSAVSGLAQATVVADAVAGRGAFRKQGPQTHIRMMADLFPETVQLVARPGIGSIAELRGKRVSLGADGSGGEVVAAAILSAGGVRAAQVRHDGADVSAAKLQQGGIDAFFFVGGGPSPAIAGLLARGAARLVPIGGTARARVIARAPGLAADTIPGGAYRGVASVDTVSVRILWVANDSAPSDTVYGLVRALYDPANHDLLAQGWPVTDIRPGRTAGPGLAPLHPGAARFYRETRRAQGY